MIFILFATLLIGLMFAIYNGSTIIITFIKGFMFGALYNKDEYDEFDSHTIQFCLAILTITILWDTEKDG